jgi:hypothetical protein
MEGVGTAADKPGVVVAAVITDGWVGSKGELTEKYTGDVGALVS